MGFHISNSRGKTEAWESITQTQGRGRSVRVHNPNSRGHTEAWESITPTQRKFYSDFNTVCLLCLSCCLLPV